MNNKKTWRLFLVILVIAMLAVTAIFGVGSPENRFIKGAPDVRTGIDIRGGINAIMVPVYPEGTVNPNVIDDLNTARAILDARLDSKGIFDKNLSIDITNQRINLEIPWAQNETDFDPQAALRELGSTALLTFQQVDESLVDEFGNPYPTGIIIMDGTEVTEAYHALDNETNNYSVFLTLSRTGQTQFAEATGRLVRQRIAIFMDDTLISAPSVSQRIDSPNARITGNFSMEEAKLTADRIRSGALPAKLEAASVDSVSPTLGRGALDVTLLAGLIALILVCLYMIFMYRLPGLVASIAVLGMVAAQVLLLANLSISLTLPGIAGIILSIGVGVDANVVISERIREELKSGKTFRSAVDAGFNRAFVAILDSNVTTIIAAGALYFLGSGPIRGFGITLGLGVMVSFLSAVTASRIMLRALSVTEFARKKWLYRVNA